ncbi:MAG: tryptophan synthase subunit alpha [Bryobacteraceae bacterium]|jgi:tryptophan synthase alpha chain
MTRIGKLFENLKRDGRKGLIAYLTAGDPSPARTPALVEALVRGGADLVELGVPFSDPIADGPVIQRAGERALKAGTTLHKVLEIASEIRKRSEVPLLLFTYLNPVVRYGLDSLAKDAAACGIDGCLLTDASVEEAHEYVGAMHRHGLDTVFLAAPTSTGRRMKLVAKYSTGFVYLVSRTGVTGEQASLSAAVAPLVRAMRAVTDLPLAVGFGISRPEHVAELATQVDAVVVGSALVRVIEQHLESPNLARELEAFVRQLKGGFGAHA